jgi:acetolactate synthase-1/2/3 large subunit
MTSQELATVAQERLPITILVLDNAQLGMVRQWQDRVYEGRHAAVRFDEQPGHPDFVRLAEAYGVPGWDVRDAAALDEALAASLAISGPSLLRIAVDARVDNHPMMPAGTSYDDFYGHCVPAPGRLFTEDDARHIEETRHAHD